MDKAVHKKKKVSDADWDLGISGTTSDQKNDDEKFKLYITYSPTPVFIINSKGDYAFVNDAACKLLGYTQKEILSMNISQIAHPDELPQNMQTFQKLLDGEQVHKEISLCHKSGEKLYVILNARLLDKDSIIGFCTDITERKRDEKEILKFSHAVQQSPVCIVITDVDGTIIYTNSKFTKTTGYSVKEVIGKNPRILKSGTMSKKHYSTLWHQITSGKSWSGEFHNKKKNGQLYWESASISAIKDNQGKIIYFVKIAEDITKRKEIENQIVESEQRLKTLFYKSPVSILIHDEHSGEILDANEAAYKSYGFLNLNELKKNNFWMEPPYSAADALQLIQKASREGLLQFEWKNRKKTGEIFWEYVTLQPIELKGKRRILSTTIDITKRKQVQDELQDSEYRLRSLTENIAGAIYRCHFDSKWTMEFISSYIQQISGYAASDFIGNAVRCYADIIHPDDRKMVADVISKAVANKTSFSVEYRIINAEGEVRWVFEKGQAFFSDSGVVEFIDGAIFDITEQMMAEQQIRENERLFRDLFDNTYDLIQSVDEEGNFIYVNPSWLKTLGYAKKEIPALNLFDVIHKNEHEHCMQIFKKVCLGESQVNVKTVFVGKDGREVAVQGSVISQFKDGVFVATQGIFRDITQSLQAEQALKQSEKKYRNLVENVNDLVYSLSKDGVINYISSNVSKYGYSLDDVVGKHFIDLVHVDDKKKVISDFQRSLTTAQESVTQFRLKLNDGSYHWFEDVGTLVTEGNAIVGLTGVLRDIDKRKRAEDQLVRSEEKFKTLFNSSTEAIFIHDPQSLAILDVNDEACHRFGFSADELKQLSLPFISDESMPSLTSTVSIQAVEKIMRGETLTTQWLSKFKSGERFWHEMSLKLVELDGKKVILAIARDINDRKKADQAIEESEKKLKLALTNLQAGLWDWNIAEQKIVYDNRWAEIIGYRLEDLSPITVELWKSFCHPEDIKIAQNKLQDHLDGHSTQYDCEYRMRHKNGEWIWVHDKGKIVFFSHDGKPLRMIGTHIDITDRKNAEKKIKDSVIELSQANKELDDFTYMVSHELKQPLRSIQAFSSFLQEDCFSCLDEKGQDYTTRISRGAQRLANLIDILLELSRIGRKDIEISSVDINEVMKKISEDITGVFADKKCRIIYSKLPVMNCQKSLIRQLFFNLINNGLKFNQSSQPTIWVFCEESADKFIFSVKDNGIGIDEKHFERIFNVFERLHSKDDYIGSGAGLAICKKIVAFHNGRIWVESKVGEGTTFHFSISKKSYDVTDD